MLRHFRFIYIVLPVLMVVGALGVRMAFAAWVPPSAAPTGNQPAPPLNTSTVGQTKQGDLTINGTFYALGLTYLGKYGVVGTCCAGGSLTISDIFWLISGSTNGRFVVGDDLRVKDRVGIGGSIDPQVPLDVNGEAHFSLARVGTAINPDNLHIMTMGNLSADTYIQVGQSWNRNYEMGWRYNADPNLAFGQIVTYGYSNDLRINSRNLILQDASGGRVGIGTTSPTAGKLTVSVPNGFGVSVTDSDNNPAQTKAGLYVSSGGGGVGQAYFYDSAGTLGTAISGGAAGWAGWHENIYFLAPSHGAIFQSDLMFGMHSQNQAFYWGDTNDSTPYAMTLTSDTGNLAVTGSITSPLWCDSAFDVCANPLNDGWLHIRNKANSFYRGVAASTAFFSELRNCTLKTDGSGYVLCGSDSSGPAPPANCTGTSTLDTDASGNFFCGVDGQGITQADADARYAARVHGFGGRFIEWTFCAGPNPRTGDCSCPAGFTAQFGGYVALSSGASPFYRQTLCLR